MDKRIKGMNRKELLELLVAQMEENEVLQQRLDQAEAELENRRITLENCGSIAEAALVLNGVFRDAENAIQQYRESAQADARKKADAILAEAEEYSRTIREEADRYLGKVLKDSRCAGEEGEGVSADL